MDSIALFFSDIDDSDSDDYTPPVNKRKLYIERKSLRDNSNVLDLPCENFIKSFRLTKEAFIYLLNNIKDDLKTSYRSTAVPQIIKLAATLRFLSGGGYQHAIGEELNIGLAQQTISYIITEVCTAIENKICAKLISLPLSDVEKKNEKKYFYENYGFPGILGVIHGTHIQIVRPNQRDHLYLNQNQKYSINAMIICDHNMKIRSVNGCNGGSSHDSHIWSISEERKYFNKCYKNGDKSTWLLGHSGYPLEPWLLTPYNNATEGSSEAVFNEILLKLRNIIEHTIGTLKGRFGCLLAGKDFHYSASKATQLLNVCCALHNICIEFKIPFGELNMTDEKSTDQEIYDQNTENSSLLAQGKKVRDSIKNIL